MAKEHRPLSPDSRAEIPLLLAVLLLPWAFAGVESWAYRGASVLIVLGALLQWVRGGSWDLRGLKRPGDLLPAALLLVLAIVQLVPLPPAVLEAVAPETAAILGQADPGAAPGESTLAAIERRALERVPEATAVVGEPLAIEGADRPLPGWRPPSLRPSATVERLLWFATLLLAFLLLRRWASDPARFETYRLVLSANLVLLALVALIAAVTVPGTILGLRDAPELSRPFGPYTNFIHFGGVMEMAVPWLAAYAWARRTRDGGWSPAALLFAAGSGVCAAAGLASASKASAILIVAGLFAVALLAVRTLWARIAVVAATLAAVVVGAILLQGSTLGRRFADFAETQASWTAAGARTDAWEASFGMMADFPLTGIGFGAFRDVYPRYLPAGEVGIWNQLHNDYLEVLVDGGVPAALAVVWLLVAFWRHARPRRLEDGGRDIEAWGLAIGVAALMVHALGDFNHQIPANALLFVALAALLQGRVGRLPGPGRDGSRVARGMLVVLLIAVVLRQGYGTIVGASYARGRAWLAAENYSAAAAALRRGEFGFDRAEALWARSVAHINFGSFLERQGHPERARDEFRAAAAVGLEGVRVAPATTWPWTGLAEAYDLFELDERDERRYDLALLGQGPWAAVGRKGAVAIGLLRTAIETTPTDFRLHDQLAQVLWRYGLTEAALEAVRQSARVQPIYRNHSYGWFQLEPEPLLSAFAEGSRDALEGSPMADRRQHLRSLATLERRTGNLEAALDHLDRAAELPADPIGRAEITYWRAVVLRDLGRTQEAAAAYESVVDVPNFRFAALTALADIAAHAGERERAVELLFAARRERPSHVGVILRYAEQASALGLRDEAIRALRRATHLEPNRPRAWDLLVRLQVEAGRNAPAVESFRRAQAVLPKGHPVLEGLRKELGMTPLGIDSPQ